MRRIAGVPSDPRDNERSLSVLETVWMTVYSAAMGNGTPSDKAVVVANNAVEDFVKRWAM